MKILHVNTGDHLIANEAIFQAGPVGAGLITCLFDNVKKSGAICYTLFITPRKDTSKVGLHLSKSLPLLIQQMMANGSTIKNIVAKVCGGAQILEPPPLLNWAETFIDHINELFKNNNILSAGCDLGGHASRRVEFNTQTGQVLIKSGLSEIVL